MLRQHEIPQPFIAAVISAPPRSISGEDILAIYDLFAAKYPTSQTESGVFLKYRLTAAHMGKALWPGMKKLPLRPDIGENLYFMEDGNNVKQTLIRPESKYFKQLGEHDEFANGFGRDVITYFRQSGIEGRVELYLPK